MNSRVRASIHVLDVSPHCAGPDPSEAILVGNSRRGGIVRKVVSGDVFGTVNPGAVVVCRVVAGSVTHELAVVVVGVHNPAREQTPVIAQADRAGGGFLCDLQSRNENCHQNSDNGYYYE